MGEGHECESKPEMVEIYKSGSNVALYLSSNADWAEYGEVYIEATTRLEIKYCPYCGKEL